VCISALVEGSITGNSVTEGRPGPTGVPPTTAAAAGAAGNGHKRPDPAVPKKPVRRRFNAEYKARILREADRLTQPGQLGALLRREGLYSSNLCVWRKQLEEAAIASLTPKRRGRKPDPNASPIAENQRLIRENAQLKKKLRRTEVILFRPKKLSEIVGDRIGAKRLREPAPIAVEELSPSVGTVAARAPIGIAAGIEWGRTKTCSGRSPQRSVRR